MSKMVKCKVCGQEIAKSAKVCPHCGAKRKKHILLGIVLVFLSIGLISAALGGTSSNEPHAVDTPTATQAPTDKSEPTTFGVGERVELNDVFVTLVNVSENTGSSFLSPDEGKVFVVCEFEIENDSGKTIAVSSMLSFKAYIDDYSTNLSLTGMMSTDKQQLDGEVDSGKKMNGVVGYQADADWQTIEIQFTPDFWSGTEIVFTYSK